MTRCSPSTFGSPTLSVGQARRLFDGIYEKGYWGVDRQYDVTADGRRFVMIKPVEDTSRSVGINVVVNWTKELGESVPAK